MSFFPVECEIFGLADFFQNLIVSRASVNGDLQKGPHLPQSFSTEPGIESGLYIAPGTQLFGSGHRFPDFGARSDRSAQDLPNLAPSPRSVRQGFRTSEPKSRFWRQSPEIPKSCRKSGNPENPRKSWKSRKSRLLAKSRDFCDFQDFRI